MELICDASPTSIAGILQQQERPVIMISKVLTVAEQKYAQIEREALAIIWSAKKLSKFLLGKPFCIIMDHKPLQYIFGPNRSIDNVTAARLQRWAIHLFAFEYNIEAVKSEEVPVADLLSRCGTIYSLTMKLTQFFKHQFWN